MASRAELSWQQPALPSELTLGFLGWVKEQLEPRLFMENTQITESDPDMC